MAAPDAADGVEQRRRSTQVHRATRDRTHFEVPVDLDIDRLDIAERGEAVDEVAQALEVFELHRQPVERSE
ncbi:MAG: hypothetical protein JO090_16475, partial [Rhizobacter sp.]|nr:hypothetical protein [Rhizobacter sp.]